MPRHLVPILHCTRCPRVSAERDPGWTTLYGSRDVTHLCAECTDKHRAPHFLASGRRIVREINAAATREATARYAIPVTVDGKRVGHAHIEHDRRPWADAARIQREREQCARDLADSYPWL